MSDFVEIVIVLEKSWLQVAEDIRSAAPVAFTSTTTLIQSSVDYLNLQQPLKSIYGFLVSTDDKTTAAEAEKLMNVLEKKFPFISPRKYAIISAVQSPQIAKDELLSSVEDCMRKSANSALGLGFALSLIGTVFEAGRIYGFWKDIRGSNVFLKDDFDKVKAAIQSKIDELPTKIKELVEGINESQFRNESPPQRVAFILRKTRKRDALRSIMDTIQQEIGELKAENDGKVEQLGTGRTASGSTDKAQAPQGISLGVNLVELGEAAGPIFAFTRDATLMANLVSAGFYLKQMDGATIGDLREKLLEIEKLRFVISGLENKLLALYEEFTDLLDDVAGTTEST